MFNRSGQVLYPKYWSFHIEKWLSTMQSNELDMASMRTEIEQRLNRFLEERLPKMEEILNQLRH